MSPHEILAVFGKPPAKQINAEDRVELTRISNAHRARKGLLPIVPSWMVRGWKHG
jgi:hypothetical protein